VAIVWPCPLVVDAYAGNQLRDPGPRQVSLGNATYRWESQETGIQALQMTTRLRRNDTFTESLQPFLPVTPSTRLHPRCSGALNRDPFADDSARHLPRDANGPQAPGPIDRHSHAQPPGS
jgi:hypothetical protein